MEEFSLFKLYFPALSRLLSVELIMTHLFNRGSFFVRKTKKKAPTSGAVELKENSGDSGDS
tara:strand:+ start:787 stop:969 length:183 start_codon:yes stop_codon:yes gene_type:complete